MSWKETEKGPQKIADTLGDAVDLHAKIEPDEITEVIRLIISAGAVPWPTTCGVTSTWL